jgi:Family of unknown function (DUF6325)
MTDGTAEVGPIDYLVMEFAGDRMTGEGLAHLLDLVDRGTIRILDLVFVRKEVDGTVTSLAINDADGDGTLDLTVFDGVGSGLIGGDDVVEAGQILEPGRAAVVAIYENTWAAPLVGALRRSGAQLVAGGRIPHEQLLDALAEVP